MTKINRAAIITYIGAERVRITRNGEVHAFGQMPNTNQTGWYFAGFADHIFDMIAYRAILSRIDGEGEALPDAPARKECASKHFDRGDDICADCGADLA